MHTIHDTTITNKPADTYTDPLDLDVALHVLGTLIVDVDSARSVAYEVGQGPTREGHRATVYTIEALMTPLRDQYRALTGADWISARGVYGGPDHVRAALIARGRGSS